MFLCFICFIFAPEIKRLTLSAVSNLNIVDMKTFDSLEGLECMNKDLDEIISVLSNFSDNGMLDLVELAYPGEAALPDKSVCSVLGHSVTTFKSLSALCSKLRDQLDLILGNSK